MTYHQPPDHYRPPTYCQACWGHIVLIPVVGGYGWRHLVGSGPAAEHDVVMRPEGWFDVATGLTEHRITILTGAA